MKHGKIRHGPSEEGNIRTICPECLAQTYVRKGTFTAKEIAEATHAKANFHGEHMWIKITERNDKGVVGTVTNIPAMSDSPKFGTQVNLTFLQIEDLGAFQ